MKNFLAHLLSVAPLLCLAVPGAGPGLATVVANIVNDLSTSSKPGTEKLTTAVQLTKDAIAASHELAPGLLAHPEAETLLCHVVGGVYDTAKLIATTHDKAEAIALPPAPASLT